MRLFHADKMDSCIAEQWDYKWKQQKNIGQGFLSGSASAKHQEVPLKTNKQTKPKPSRCFNSA